MRGFSTIDDCVMSQIGFPDCRFKVWSPPSDVGKLLDTLEGISNRCQIADLLLFSPSLGRISQYIGYVILRLRQDDELGT